MIQAKVKASAGLRYTLALLTRRNCYPPERLKMTLLHRGFTPYVTCVTFGFFPLQLNHMR